jgi:hypothetical protein
MLLARLATAGVTLDNLIEKDNNERANVKLVEDFCAELPKSKRKECYWAWSFSSTNPDQIRNIALNVVWVRVMTDNLGTEASVPFYVVGASRGNDGKRTGELLLAAAVVAENSKKIEALAGKLVSFPTKKYHKRNMDEIASLQASDFPTPEETVAMFDRDAHEYRFTSNSPRAVEFSNDYGGPLVGLGNSKDLVTHLTDKQMADYDVNRRLHSLAAQFGKVQALDALLQK